MKLWPRVWCLVFLTHGVVGAVGHKLTGFNKNEYLRLLTQTTITTMAMISRTPTPQTTTMMTTMLEAFVGGGVEPV